MSQKMETFTVRDHATALRFKDRLREAYQRIVLDGGAAMEIRIGVHQTRRTRAQNALQHKWYGEIAEATGHTASEVKEALKRALLPSTVISVMGKQEVIPVPTSSLTKREAMDYMDRIQAMAAEYGIALTDPGEAQWRDWLEQAAEEEANGRRVLDTPRAGSLESQVPVGEP